MLFCCQLFLHHCGQLYDCIAEPMFVDLRPVTVGLCHDLRSTLACAGEQGDSKHAAAEKQQLDRQAHEHAQAQTQLVTAANSLAKKATAHMHAQVRAA